MERTEAKPTIIKVGLFPWTPYPSGWEDAVKRVVDEELHGKVEVEFFKPADWCPGFDCYGHDVKNPIPVDVAVLDCLLLRKYVRAGLVSPLPPEILGDPSDFYDHCVQASEVDGKIYGIPMFSCSTFLFGRAVDDAFFPATQSLSSLHSEVGPISPSQATPLKGKGILGHLRSNWTIASYYTTALWSLDVKNIPSPPVAKFPSTPDEVNPRVMDHLRILIESVGLQIASTKEKALVVEGEAGEAGSAKPKKMTYGRLMKAGYGRAAIGYSEARMMSFPPDAKLKVVPVPMPSTSSGIVGFYVDTICVPPSTMASSRRELALAVARIVGSAKVSLMGNRNTGEGGHRAQYVIPARKSALKTLATEEPDDEVIFGDIRGFLDELRIVPVLYDADGPTWVEKHCERLLTNVLLPKNPDE